ncbi:hypothetical protein CPB85DRAFT_1562430 [Mucidula mucida]|nr:hypothetical protein CPB85DRAFT_1562430 [Mucidula mucida]
MASNLVEGRSDIGMFRTDTHRSDVNKSAQVFLALERSSGSNIVGYSQMEHSHNLPPDVVRVLMEAAARSGRSAAHNLTLVSKDACQWVDPILYHTVALALMKIIPEDDYDYQFLCLSPPEGRQWRVDGVAYPFPVQNFPPPMRSVYVSWLFDAKFNFPERLPPFARRDPPEYLPPPSQPARSIEEPPASRSAGSKRVRITSPPKSTFKRAGTSIKKAVLKASSSKATLCRKPPAKKREVSQSSAAEEERPLKPRRSLGLLKLDRISFRSSCVF